MQPGPGSGQGRAIAVGPSRVVAARVFGTFFDDAHVTSYADFSTEVDASSVASVGLVGTAETAAFLTDLLAGSRQPPRVLLGLTDDFAGTDRLLLALADDPALRPANVVRVGTAVVVQLEPADRVADADADRVLAVLQALEPTPLTHDVDQDDPPAVAPSSDRRLLSRLVSRLSRTAPREP